MAKKDLEKLTKEEIKNKSKVAFNPLTYEEKVNLVLEHNKKMAYFDIGHYTSDILSGLSLVSAIGGLIYNKPEYIVVGAAGAVLSILYLGSLGKDIKDYNNYLNDLMDSTTNSSKNNNPKEDKDKSNFEGK
jgi:hypothetical protein